MERFYQEGFHILIGFIEFLNIYTRKTCVASPLTIISLMVIIESDYARADCWMLIEVLCFAEISYLTITC